MHTETLARYFAVGAAAAVSFELLKLYGLRGKLTSKKYTARMRSPLYWLVALGMVLASGFFAWVFYAERADATALQLALAGIASRSLLRDGIGALTSRHVDLGNRVTLGDAFE
jgi:hypothetical protein